MSKFEVKSVVTGDTTVFRLSGAIDEDAVFARLPVPQTAKFEIDLQAISGINSCGVREWIRWQNGLASNLQIFLSHVPRVLVEQMNMVAGFLKGGTHVKSFQVPFFCESCEIEVMVMYTEGAHYQGKELKHPSVNCSKCGKATELDVMEAKYFRFL